MKKLKNKAYRDESAKRHHDHKLERKREHPYQPTFDSYVQPVDNEAYDNKKNIVKKRKLVPPKQFSLIMNPEKTLHFFHTFFKSIKIGYNSIFIDMYLVEELTMEVLLYIISLDKIYKKSDNEIHISIRVPKKKELKYLIAQSGLGEYFHSNVNIKLDENDIFSIQDGETNEEKNIDDEDTCANAVDFALKFFESKSIKDTEFRSMFNALAEMMTNTDNHAYLDEEYRNWYLYAVKVETGIAFYFFDNGRGIIRTAKKNMLEKAMEYTFSLGHKSIMKAVLNGDYRSATGLPYRNKGLPEINDFLTRDYVSSPMILTDKLFCLPQKDVYNKNKYNFRGSLFVWILKNEES